MMNMRPPCSRRGLAGLGLAVLLALSFQAGATTGKMTKREPIPMPPTDSNGCMLESISGSPSRYYQLEGRAKRQAIDNWKKQVKREAPPQFASWEHANRYTKSMNCEKFRGQFYCWAKAVPCDKRR